MLPEHKTLLPEHKTLELNIRLCSLNKDFVNSTGQVSGQNTVRVQNSLKKKPAPLDKPSPGQSREENPYARLLSQRPRHLMVVCFRKLEEQRGLKNHNKIKIEWFGTKTTFLSRTGPRKMMGSWQARHFVQNFDADLVGWV